MDKQVQREAVSPKTQLLNNCRINAYSHEPKRLCEIQMHVFGVSDTMVSNLMPSSGKEKKREHYEKKSITKNSKPNGFMPKYVSMKSNTDSTALKLKAIP